MLLMHVVDEKEIYHDLSLLRLIMIAYILGLNEDSNLALPI